MNDIEIFVDRLIEEKQFGDLEPEVMEEIKKDLLSRVEDRMNMTILNELPEDALPAFEELLDKEESEEDMKKFISSKIPDLDEKIAKALVDFRNTYLY